VGSSDMGIEVKRVNDNEYLQFKDKNGYIHHVGPVDPQNLAICHYLLGDKEHWSFFDYMSTRRRWLEDKLLSLGYPTSSDKEEGSVQYFVDLILDYFYSGYGGRTSKSSDVKEFRNVNQKISEVGKRALLFEILEDRISTKMMEDGESLDKNQLRKIVYAAYKKAPEKQRKQWIEEHDARLFSARAQRRL
jgi:hypothetical protein